MKSLIKRSIHQFLSMATRAAARKYIQKDRWYSYKTFELKIYKGVFHPGLFRSTEIFAAWLATQDLQDKMVIEIGSGSGLLSLIAASKGAKVTAVDINPRAVANTQFNAAHNNLHIDAFYSDLFSETPSINYELVLINPPYYPKTPKNDYEKAWYCGEGFAYFKQLFGQLLQRKLQNKCVMILSDTCDIAAIESIAAQFGICLQIVSEKTVRGEKLIICNTASATGLAEAAQ